ncbi:MAG TPA: DUF4388 domain-containing protein [Geobacteraceae bacterium]
MSFTGDLEHLPIVDVIQLLHSTRKSGILRVKCHKGESQLVFKDGYFVSANHLNNKIKIGKILVDLKVITPEVLESALQAQKEAGPNQKPLIITLIENGQVNEKDAYRGLEQLIEMAVVEVLTWEKGTFTLDVLPESITDEYIYYTGKTNGEIKIDTQRILMDALRIIDEKVRDGELAEAEEVEEPEDDFAKEEFRAEETAPEGGMELISPDDLGLGQIEHLETKIPEVFTVLEDRDPGKIMRRELEKLAPTLPVQEREMLAAFFEASPLEERTAEVSASEEAPAQPVLFFSSDEFAKYAIAAACKNAGVLVFATDDEENLDPIIQQSLAKNSLPLLVFDAPDSADGDFSPEKIALLRRQKKEKYPQMDIIQLVAQGDQATALQSYGDGAMAVFPKPVPAFARGEFAAATMQFLQAFRAYTRRYASERDDFLARELRKCVRSLRGLRNAPEVASVLLSYVAGICERSVTLIVRETELVAEKGIGVKAEKEAGPTPAMRFRLPLAKPSLLYNVINEGNVFFGKTEDATIKEHLFAAIGEPAYLSILLLPLKVRGKTISLTYGDFGAREPRKLDLAFLDIVASQSELVMESFMHHKKFEKPPAKE